MKLTVDTNILFSALLHKRRIHDLLFYNPELELYTPELLHQELRKHHEKLAKLTKLTREETRTLIEEILPRRITTIPTKEYKKELLEAVKLVKKVDPDDWPFIALAIHLKTPLWTGDKKILKLSATTNYEHFIAIDTEGVELLLNGEPLEKVKERMQEKYGQDKNTREIKYNRGDSVDQANH